EIVPTLKLDKRIGAHAYLAPGLGIAGGNLERDLATVCRLSEALGTDAGVVRAWIANSRHRKDWVLRTLEREVLARRDNPVIDVLPRLRGKVVIDPFGVFDGRAVKESGFSYFSLGKSL